MALIKKFKLQSDGGAYNLDVGFVPDTVTVWNYTKWETDGQKVKFYWHRGMTDGYALSELCEDTANNRAIETSNGFTEYDSTSITDNSKSVTGVTQADPGVVTVASTSGWYGWDDKDTNPKPFGDNVRFDDIGGMTELNSAGVVKIKDIIDSTTFSIDLDTSGYTTFSAGSARNQVINISQNITNSGFKGITLGSTVMCNDNDILYIECTLSDEYKSLGDIA